MYPGEDSNMTLSKYRQLEMQLHIELMNTCRKYMSQLGILSIMGILDVVKQESIELEGATRKNIKKEGLDTHIPENETDYFLEKTE